MIRYSHEDVRTIFTDVLNNVELDLVHHIKHSKSNTDDYVHQLRTLNRLTGGINSRLEEVLNVDRT